MRSPKIRSRMLIPTVQCIFLLYACLCSVSRITDNRHHWWDVLAGAKIGILFASLVVNFQKNIILFRKWVQFIQSNRFHLIYSVSSCARISKQKKHQTSSQWFQTAPQSTIGTQVFVVFYPNEPKMSWIWTMLWYPRNTPYSLSLVETVLVWYCGSMFHNLAHYLIE